MQVNSSRGNNLAALLTASRARRGTGAQHQLVSTGERLTRETLAKARSAGGTVIIHGRPEEQTRAAIVSPLADFTIFDPATVIDRATSEDATIASAGIPFVIVGGQVVVDGGARTRGPAVRSAHVSLNEGSWPAADP